MATSSSTGGGSAAGEDSSSDGQALSPAALRAGVKLQAGTTLKISVIGVSGRPLPGGRSSRGVKGVGGGADGSGSSGGEGDSSQETVAGGAPGGDGADVHVLAAEVRSIGDTLMPNQKVRIHALDTGEKVAEAVTDDSGILRVNVPRDANYRIEIVDEAQDAEPPGLQANVERGPFYRVVAKFVDGSGAPLKGESVEIADGDDTTTATTDDDGLLDLAAAELKAYQLTVRGTKFAAHALPSEDHDKSADNASLFTVAAAEAA